MDQMDLIDFNRIFHPTAAQFTLFSAAHETFPQIYHILGHKENLNEYKKIN
jgi:hypothetical protein